MDHEFDLPHDSPSGPPQAPPAGGAARTDADDDSLRVAIDACRPGSDDRQLPEVAAVLARHPAAAVERMLCQSEKVDRAIMGAMRHLAAPEHLAERLMTALAAQRAEMARVAQCDASEAARANTSCPASSPSRDAEQGGDRLAAARQTRPRPWAIVRGPRTRRAWLATASLALVAVAGAYFAWPTHRRLAQEAVEQSAREFYLQDDHAAVLSQASTVADWPRTVSLTAYRRGWRRVDSFLGRSGVVAVAHELVNSRGIRATLYAVPLDALGAVGLDPSVDSSETASSLTAGMPTARAWAEADSNYLFVLVVNGNSRDLDSFIRSADLA